MICLFMQGSSSHWCSVHLLVSTLLQLQKIRGEPPVHSPRHDLDRQSRPHEVIPGRAEQIGAFFGPSSTQLLLYRRVLREIADRAPPWPSDLASCSFP